MRTSQVAQRIESRQRPGFVREVPLPTHTLPGVDGLRSGLEVRSIPLGDIDPNDDRFQYRLQLETRDLRESIDLEGQQSPITLWGKGSPYVIIDGFRRYDAVRALGWQRIKALVRDDIDEQMAYALSFTENVRRRNYSPLDKAHAIWVAAHRRGLDIKKISIDFGLSERQVHRYLRLLDLGEELKAALGEGRISMGHAALIHRSRGEDVAGLIRAVVSSSMSVGELKKQLTRRRAGRPRCYIVRDGQGFRAQAFRYDPAMRDREKQRILQALELALSVVRQTT